MSTLLEQASLVLIPSGYKEDVVYSQIPTDGSGDLSFTRASNGTRINSAGLVEVCPWNLLQQSNAFSTSPWLKSSTTLTSGQTDPNGGSNAWKVEFAGGGSAYLGQFGMSQIGVVTISAYFRADVTTTIGFNDGSAFANSITIGTTWQRYEFSYAVTAGQCNMQIDNYFGVSPSGQAKTFYIWGAQLNIGSTAKPYFPTTDRLNVPRLTYQNGGGGCPSLLLEKQSTNIMQYSQDLANAWFSIFDATATGNSAISPDGTQNATNLSFDAVGAARLEKAIGGTYESQTHTVSVYAKVTSGTQTFRLKCTHAGVVDYLSGDFTVTTEWQRFTFTQAFGATVGSGIVGGIQNGSNSTAKNILFYGFQLEPNTSYPTSYIPTTSASATRVADYGSSPLQTTNANWTIYVDTYFVQYQEILNLLIQTTTSRFVGIYESFNYFRLVGNAGAGVFAGRVMSDTDGRKKVVLQNDGTDCIVYVNGVKLGGINTSGASPLTGRASFLFQFYGGGTGVVNKGRINELIQFDTKLSDADCIALSTL